MDKASDLSFELGFFERLHKRMPSDVKVVSILAHLYTKTGAIDRGLRMDRKLARLCPDDPVVHYNLACSLALKGRFADSVRALRTAVTLGYSDFNWMNSDPDLAVLQDYAGFQSFKEELGCE